jgi:hypothetical protein
LASDVFFFELFRCEMSSLIARLIVVVGDHDILYL